jgi:hypothetical protein
MKTNTEKSPASQLASMRWAKWTDEQKEAHMKKMEVAKKKYWEKKRRLDKKGKIVLE